VLVLQDTTEFSFKREGAAAAGFAARADSRKAGGKPQVHTVPRDNHGESAATIWVRDARRRLHVGRA